MALACRAGALLKVMEFCPVPSHRASFYRHSDYGRSRRRGWLLNKDGYRYLQDYDPGKPEQAGVAPMELGPRIGWFRLVMSRKRAHAQALTELVHLDLRHLGTQIIDKKLPFVRNCA